VRLHFCAAYSRGEWESPYVVVFFIVESAARGNRGRRNTLLLVIYIREDIVLVTRSKRKKRHAPCDTPDVATNCSPPSQNLEAYLDMEDKNLPHFEGGILGK
jgi:hypothetical protein